MEVESQVHLYGHSAEVSSLFVCKPYSVLISVSEDGTCILWDLNRCVTRFPTITRKKSHWCSSEKQFVTLLIT